MLNFISVKEQDNYIYIRYINRDLLLTTIIKYLENTRFTNNIFKEIAFGVKFHSFFLVDVFYVLNNINEQTNLRYYKKDLKYLLTTILEGFKQNTRLSNIENNSSHSLDLSILDKIHYTMKEYQYEYLKFYSEDNIDDSNGSVAIENEGLDIKTFYTYIESSNLNVLNNW